jgi:Mg-chelatase subunit ChlD
MRTCVAALLLAGVTGAATAAPTSDVAGPGLDLVLLIDRSGSMTGAARTTQNLFARVAFELVAQNGTANRVVHRFGIVSFGSSAQVELPLAAIHGDEVSRVRGIVENLPTSAGGNTDVLAAFDAARRVLAVAPAAQSRRRAILLLTDGAIDVPDAPLSYVDDLRRLVAASFPSSTTTIDVVLLPSRAGRGALRKLWRELSRGRLHELSGNPSEMLADLHRLVTQIVGTRSVGIDINTTETLVLPPYLDVVVFDIVGRGDVSIYAPGATQPLARGAEGVERLEAGSSLSTTVVHRPAPGRWRFRARAAAAHAQIFAQEFFPRGVLIRPDSHDVRQRDRVTVAYRLIEADGTSLRELPAYPLSLSMTLALPDERRLPLPMNRDHAQGNVVFRSRDELSCGAAGHYWTEVHVTAVDADRRPVLVFEDRWSGFDVSAAARIDCRVSNFDADLVTHIACLDERAHPVELAPLVDGPAASVITANVSRNGRASTLGLALSYAGAGAFVGRIREAGMPGAYCVQLAADRTRLAPSYNVRFSPSTLSFTLTRRLHPWSVVAAVAVIVTVCTFLLRR